jgi:hypothetical protein
MLRRVSRRPTLLFACAGALCASVLAGFALHGPKLLDWLRLVSYTTDDRTKLAPGEFTVPLVGRHHFGDWQVFMHWAGDPNPYLSDSGGLHSLPPMLWLLRVFEPMPLLASLVTILVMSLLATLVPVWLLLDDRPWGERVLASAVLFAFSAGFISSVDRGQFQGLAVGFVGLWLWAQRTERERLSIVFLAAAIVVKPYLVLLLLWPIAMRQWRHVVSVIGVVAVPSLVGFAVLPGPFVATIEGYLHSSGQYTTHWADSALFWTHSMLGVVVHPVIFSTRDPLLALTWLDALPPASLVAPGLVWLGLVSWLVARRRVSDPLLFCLVLSLTFLVLPSAQAYAALTAGIGVLVLMTSPAGPPTELLARRAVQVALVLTVAPIPVGVNGPYIVNPVGVSGLLVPIAWLVSGCICALASRRPTDVTSPSSTPRAAEPVLR